MSQVETTLEAVPETARGPVQCAAMDGAPGPLIPCPTPADWSALFRCAMGDEWTAAVCDRHLRGVDEDDATCSAHRAVTVTVAAYPLGTS